MIYDNAMCVIRCHNAKKKKVQCGSPMSKNQYYLGPFVACRNTLVGEERAARVPLDYRLPDESDLYRALLPGGPDSYIIDWRPDGDAIRCINWSSDGLVWMPIEDVGAQVEWFKKEFARDISELKGVYGEEQVKVRFGIVSHYYASQGLRAPESICNEPKDAGDSNEN